MSSADRKRFCPWSFRRYFLVVRPISSNRGCGPSSTQTTYSTPFDGMMADLRAIRCS
ncbi:hypothetical protein CEP51_016827, partial [Fusarium floridanum]